ncbi:hypothetical protein ACFVH6_32550 [Spirillospora sp. NPDC127200]
MVSVGRGFEGASVLSQAAWPGLPTMLVVTEQGRQILNDRLPRRPVPAGGARWYSPAVDRTADQVLGPVQALRAGMGLHLTDQILTARAATTPAGLAADAAVLLTDPAPPLPVPHAPPPPDPGTMVEDLARQPAAARDRLQAQHAQLAQARDGRAAAETHAADLAAELDKTTRLLHDRDKELQQLAARLQDQQTALDSYAAAAAVAEQERDQTVRDRGIAELRRAHVVNQPAGRPEDPSLQDLQTPVPGDFATLLRDAAGRFPLLVFDVLDVQAATALDAHPLAAAWRRKTWTPWQR